MTSWSADDVRRIRLRSLLLSSEPMTGTDPVSVARWFGAMQAQDVASGWWSLGVRAVGTTVSDVTAAFESGALIRTWPMRGTLHIVAAENARWMLNSAGARALTGVQRRWDYLGLDERTVRQGADVLRAALKGGARLTRTEALDVLRKAGVDPAGQRGYHLLWYAAQTAVTCVADLADGTQAFRLLDEWAPRQRDLGADEAWAEWARLYFRAHGPATQKDFQGWAGLPASAAKQGIAEVGADLVSADVDGQTMWAAAEVVDLGPLPTADRSRVWALPGYDEFVLGFKDRSLLADEAGRNALVPGNNGVFRATLMRDGRVLATWRRTLAAAAVRVEVTPLPGIGVAELPETGDYFADYGRFLQRTVKETRWNR